MRIKTYCKFLVVLVCLFLCFGFVSTVGASDVAIEMEQVAQASSTSSPQSYLDWRDIEWKDPFLRNEALKTLKTLASSKVPTNSDVSVAIAQVAKSDATIKLELKIPSPQSYLDWRDIEWKDPFLRHGQVNHYSSPKAPTNADVSAVITQVDKSDSTIVGASDVAIEMEQVAQASSTSSPQSYLDWRDIEWKDPFLKHGQVNHYASSKAPTNADVSVAIAQVDKSDSTMKLELRMPSSTSIMPSDSFDDLEDPFASKLDTPDIPDPFEGYNRFMFDFNEGFYDDIMEPVVREYREYVNEDIRVAIANVFDNAMAPLKLVSSFLQGDIDKTGRVIGRTVINTTLGLGGMFDVADKAFDIKDVNEDLDQVMGKYGIPTGPYVVLPLFGPSSVRNVFGRVGGIFLSPTFHFAPGVEVGASLTVTEQVNGTSFIVDDIEQIDDSALDKYEMVRDFYGQYRAVLVNE